MSELDDVWVSVEQLDASFQEHSATAATATAAVNASVVSLQREAQSDRQALRGLMEMMEDTMPIADAHEIIAQQSKQFATELASVHARCDNETRRLEALETAQEAAKAEREAAKEERAELTAAVAAAKTQRDETAAALRAQEQQCEEWAAAQARLQDECVDLARQLVEQEAAGQLAVQRLAEQQQERHDELLAALAKAEQRQTELEAQIGATADALRDDAAQEKAAQEAALTELSVAQGPRRASSAAAPRRGPIPPRIPLSPSSSPFSAHSSSPTTRAPGWSDSPPPQHGDQLDRPQLTISSIGLAFWPS